VTRTSTTGKSRRRVAVVAMALVAGLVLVACGQEKYRYVANRSLGSYLRMPSEWAVQDVTASQADGRVKALPSGIQSVWKLAFAGSGGGAVDDEGLPDEVTGRVEVYSVSDYYREQYSISALRSTQTVGMAVDPVYPPDEVGSEKVELSIYEKLSKGGVTGSRSVANINAAPDGSDPAWVTQDLTVLFDHDGGKIYVLSMYCSGSCYLQNQKTINEVATSFAVRNGG